MIPQTLFLRERVSLHPLPELAERDVNSQQFKKNVFTSRLLKNTTHVLTL